MSSTSTKPERGSASPVARRRIPLWFLAVPVLGLALALPLFFNQSTSSGAQPIAQLNTEDVHTLAFSPSDPNVVFFGHHNGLLISTDRGTSWKPASLQGADAMILGTSSATPERLYVAGHGVFMRSDDAGQTWMEPPSALQGADMHAFAVHPANADHIYAYVEGQGIQQSMDGGSTWLPLPRAIGRVTALAASKDGLLYAGTTTEGVFESTDGGRSWQRGGLSSFGTHITSLALDSTSGDVYAAAVMNAGQTMLHRRVAASGAWEQVPLQGTGVILAVAVSPHADGTLIVADQATKVYRSSDKGQSWQ